MDEQRKENRKQAIIIAAPQLTPSTKPNSLSKKSTAASSEPRSLSN